MKGKNLVNIPGELRSVATDGVVTSAEGVMDYQEGKNQEEINRELMEGKASMDSAMERLRQYNDATIAAIERISGSVDEETLSNEQRLNLHADALSKIADQLGSSYDENEPIENVYTPGLKLMVVEEDEMAALIQRKKADRNTIYLQLEPEE